MSNETLKQQLAETFQMYDLALYTMLKWSITMPCAGIGNAVDLLFCGIPKNHINVSPCMKNFPFFRQATREKEQTYDDCCNPLANRGIGGVLRAMSSIGVEIPVSFVSVGLALPSTALHLVIAKTCCIPVTAVANYVAENMCGRENTVQPRC